MKPNKMLLPAILRHPIVPEREHASSRSYPAQGHSRPPTDRNDQIILAAFDAAGRGRGYMGALRKRLFARLSRALPARHRGCSSLTTRRPDGRPAEGTRPPARIVYHAAPRSPPVVETRKGV